MAVKKTDINAINQRIPQPQQVEVALSRVVDALVHHGSCQGVSILILVVVQWEEPEWNSTISSKIYNVMDLTLCGDVSGQ